MKQKGFQDPVLLTTSDED